MAEDETSEATAPPGESTSERLDHMESDISWIKDKLSHLVPGSHAEAQQRTERRLDRGSEMEEIVRAELAKKDQLEAEKKEKADRENAEREHAEQHARLLEKPPAPPRSRKTAALGWGDGRS